MEFMTERQAALSLWLHELMADESLSTLLPVRKFLGEGANQMPRGAKPVTSKSAQGQDPYKEDKTVGGGRANTRPASGLRPAAATPTCAQLHLGLTSLDHLRRTTGRHSRQGYFQWVAQEVDEYEIDD